MPTHLRREIGRGGLHPVYQGVLFWECPDCGGQWHRFTIASREHHWAKKYMTWGIADRSILGTREPTSLEQEAQRWLAQSAVEGAPSIGRRSGERR